ncbi:Nuclear membrane fusion protein Kar5 [Teratosphaeria destructans]|uniref:Nuclear membrane fusion protein Kar5 n=1 Tax=Teratosphaeria destructans TaxID=418781 RepID=A0A9W7SSI0_9PEZI|nr:Nuclear membrane fusion protein Kar5 [Teratosphaeria destructans]
MEGSVSDSSPSSGSDAMLIEEMNLYASRLAVCEINSAGARIPTACQAFVPTVKNAKKSSFVGYLTGERPSAPRQLYPQYEEATQSNLDQCLAALYAESQTWTSFTNSKQNAAMMCHSMRGEVEKDQQIAVHKILNAHAQEVSDALMQSKNDWQEFKAGHSELCSMMRKAHMELSEGYDGMLKSAQQFWAAWDASIRAGINDISADILKVKANIDDLFTDLKTGQSGVIDTLSQVDVQFKDLALQHQAQADRAAQDAVAINDLVSYTTEVLLQNLGQQVYSITGSIDAMNAAMADQQQRMNDLALDLTSTNAQISNVSAGIADVQEQMEKLEDAAASVEKLKEAIDSVFGMVNQVWPSLATFLRHGVFAAMAVSVVGGVVLLCWILSYFTLSLKIVSCVCAMASSPFRQHQGRLESDSSTLPAYENEKHDEDQTWPHVPAGSIRGPTTPHGSFRLPYNDPKSGKYYNKKWAL